MIKIQKCKYNGQILCGVVSNLDNCPYSIEAHCGGNNSTRWLGRVNPSFGTITLQEYRFNIKRIPIKYLDDNQCDDCGVIWAVPIEKCPICKIGE